MRHLFSSFIKLFIAASILCNGPAFASDKLWDEYNMMTMNGEADLFRLEQMFHEAEDLTLKSSTLTTIMFELSKTLMEKQQDMFSQGIYDKIEPYPQATCDELIRIANMSISKSSMDIAESYISQYCKNNSFGDSEIIQKAEEVRISLINCNDFSLAESFIAKYPDHKKSGDVKRSINTCKKHLEAAVNQANLSKAYSKIRALYWECNRIPVDEILNNPIFEEATEKYHNNMMINDLKNKIDNCISERLKREDYNKKQSEEYKIVENFLSKCHKQPIEKILDYTIVEEFIKKYPDYIIKPKLDSCKRNRYFRRNRN